MSRLSINLVTYNGAKYLPFLFDSLKKQTFKEWTIFVIDNNSSDNSVEILKKELNNLFVQANNAEQFSLVEKKENVGFASAHNQLFQQTKAEYFLVLNQDVKLELDCLKKLVNFLETNKQVASVSPRLMRWDKEKIIDSLGLKINPNRRVVERLAGKTWSEFDKKTIEKMRIKQTEVFGVSATCVLYRHKAIEKVAYHKKQMFDNSYFAYKEDVDLAYRLQQAKFKSFVLLDCVAYHDRSAVAGNDLTNKQAFKNKKNQPELIKYYSYKNHLATLYKNEYWQNVIIDLPWIVWYELKKFFYFLLFDRAVLKGLLELWKSRGNLKQKRRLVKENRQINWKKMRKWWR